MIVCAASPAFCLAISSILAEMSLMVTSCPSLASSILICAKPAPTSNTRRGRLCICCHDFTQSKISWRSTARRISPFKPPYIFFSKCALMSSKLRSWFIIQDFSVRVVFRVDSHALLRWRVYRAVFYLLPKQFRI